MQTDQQRLDFIIHALADPDVHYDYQPEQIERMKLEQVELEERLKGLE